MNYDVLMPWCNPCRSYHYYAAPGCFNREAFESATWDARSALHNFWIVHKALMRTLGEVA
jgi:hypothetical protein